MKLIIFLFFIATIEPARLKSVLSRSAMCSFENCTNNDIVPTSAQNQGSTEPCQVFFLIFWSHLGSGQIISYLVRRSLHRTKITLVITRPRNWELVANKQHKCNSIFCNKKWQRCSFADKTILTNCFSNCNNFGLINDPWTLRSKTVSRPLVFLKFQMADNKLVSKSIYDFRKRH